MSEVRVRFAPSPTGNLHAGNVRTALLNWIFAKQQNGVLILRIEDTDQDRHVIDSEEGIVNDLNWLGIKWSEGPDIGGDFGPYRQSDRSEIHGEYAERLLREGKAYKCYCSEDELKKEREETLAKGLPPKYNGKCRDLSAEEENKKISEGIKPVLRFEVRDGEVSFVDLIKGEISWKLSNIGDFIILRSNGMPSYNFAVVIDDALMKISHVIRGEGHVSNTPRQLLIYEALGFMVPKFAHTPTILNKEKKTLSKRNGALSIRRYREEGYIPEALVNYLSLLSWSSKSGDELLSKERIISEFSFSRMSSSAAVFDDDKLLWMNGQYIRALTSKELLNLSLPILEKSGYQTENFETTSLIVEAVQGNLTKMSDLPQYVEVFYKTEVEPDGAAEMELIKRDESKQVFSGFINSIEDYEEISAEGFKEIMKKVQNDTGVKGKDLWMPIRIAITGQSHGPELPMLIEYFGKEKVVARINKVMEI
ncbi:MAG: glutamate--tRNA ligase [Candidatus Marinimicrobia bacterium]|nr:glutamate--tRNA ligase [Candidatus Neomarinimicrobiota bacterium]MCH7954544.1 glutamate--tRNA ligase [Candidatus Neomarinimicrobiota bacterium]